MRKVFVLLKSIQNSLHRKLRMLGDVVKYSLEVKANLKVNPQPKLSKLHKNEIKQYYSSIGQTKITTQWHRFYAGVYGDISKHFIPKTFFYSRLEDVLNRRDFTMLQDKNLLDRLFVNVKQPVGIIKNINGFLYDESILVSEEDAINKITKYDKFIIKPSIESGGGKNIQLIQKDVYSKFDKVEYFKSLFIEYKKDYIIQEVLEQNKFMAKLNPSSLNTIRICTYLRPNEAVVLSAILRVGGKGMHVDNNASGGQAFAIESNGRLHKQGYTKHSFYKERKLDNVPLDEFKVPNFDKVKEKVKELHLQIPYFKVVSWDIAIDKHDDPVLLEMNVFGQGVSQQAHVGPFFAGYTDEVLDYYKSHK